MNLDKHIVYFKNLFHEHKIILMSIQYVVAIVAIIYLIVELQAVEFNVFKLWYLLLMIISIVFMRLFSLYRLVYFMKKIGNFSFRKLANAHFIGVSLGHITPGKLGESYKVLTLGDSAREKKKILSVFVSEKILDIGAYAIFGLGFAVITNTYLIPSLILFALVMIGTIIYLKMNKFFSMKSKLFFTPRAIIVSILHYGSFLFSFWMVLLAANIPANFIEAAIIITLASIVGLLSSLPGGLGAREVTGTAMISSLWGVSASIAGTISLVHTLLNYAVTWSLTILYVLCTGNAKEKVDQIKKVFQK